MNHIIKCFAFKDKDIIYVFLSYLPFNFPKCPGMNSHKQKGAPAHEEKIL